MPAVVWIENMYVT